MREEALENVALLGCGFVAGAFLVWDYLLPKDIRSDDSKLDRMLLCNNDTKKNSSEEEEIAMNEGSLDLRRKSIIAHGGAFDLAGHVVVWGDADFDLNKTIFSSVEGKVQRSILAQRVGVKLFWSEASQKRIDVAFKRIPKAPRHDKALREFMANDCDFLLEHADGNFMDHLTFCYEYSSVHFKEHSPRVLLLHSILGVATNIFPMSTDKIPNLRSLLTEFEFDQIAMFPSLLRLITSGPLLDELLNLVRYKPQQLKRLKTVVCYRVIDNERITMESDSFWIQLNYQAMHLLDFIPVVSWKDNGEDIFLRNFSLLHEILVGANKLMCHIDFELQEAESMRAGQRVTLAKALLKLLPSDSQWKMARKSVKKFSDNIGHSLDYELNFSD